MNLVKAESGQRAAFMAMFANANRGKTTKVFEPHVFDPYGVKPPDVPLRKIGVEQLANMILGPEQPA